MMVTKTFMIRNRQKIPEFSSTVETPTSVVPNIYKQNIICNQRHVQYFLLRKIEYNTNMMTYIIKFLLQICQVYFSDFTKPISTDKFHCTETIILIKKTAANIKNAIHSVPFIYCYYSKRTSLTST